MEDVLQPGLFQRQTYSGRFLSMGEQGLVRGANQLVGGVRLRQYRVQNDRCANTHPRPAPTRDPAHCA